VHAVVPERDRVRPPLEAALEVIALRVTIAHVEDRIAFEPRQANDVLGEVAVDEERPASGNRVDAHDGMFRARKVARLFYLLSPAPHAVAVVYGRQSINHLLHWFGQGLVCPLHVDKERIAAGVGQRLMQVEYQAHRWRRAAGDVGVLHFPGDVLGVLVPLDLDDLGVGFHA